MKYDPQNSGFSCADASSWQLCCRHRSAEIGNVVIYHLTGGGHEIFEQAASKLTTSLLWIVFFIVMFVTAVCVLFLVVATKLSRRR